MSDDELKRSEDAAFNNLVAFIQMRDDAAEDKRALDDAHLAIEQERRERTAKAADATRAKGKATRAKILEMLAETPKPTVAAMARRLDINTRTVSRHLAAVKKVGHNDG